MQSYNLLDDQKAVVRDMVAVYQQTRVAEFFAAPTYGSGNFVEFNCNPKRQVQCSMETLRVLATADLISLRHERTDCGQGLFVDSYSGSLKQSAIDAVAADFKKSAPVPTIGQIGQAVFGNVSGGSLQAAIGNHNTLRITNSSNAEVVKAVLSLLNDLKPLLQEIMPANEANAAEGDLQEIERQVTSPEPAKDVIHRRLKALGRKCVDVIDWGIDAADAAATRADRLGGAILKIGGLVALVAKLIHHP